MIIKDLKSKIKLAMSENNWTQERISEYLGISKRSLNNILDSNEVIKLDVFIRLCGALDVSPSSLIAQAENLVDDDSLQPENHRLVMEVDYENYGGNSIKKIFAIPYNEGEHFLTVKINEQVDLDIIKYQDIRFPYLKNNSTKLFRTNNGFNELDMGIVIGFNDFLICSKLDDKSKIESGRIYVTISSSGKDVAKLITNSKTDKIDFVGIDYENGKPKDKLISSLPLGEIYEVWKIEVLASDPSSNGSSSVIVEELKMF